MNTSQWKRARATFEALVELEAAERATRLAPLGRADPEVGQWVQALLDGDERAAKYLDPLESLFAPKGPADVESADARGSADPLGLCGEVVSHFRIVDVLGVGGMGIVYRAEDTRLGRAVALKFLLPEHGRDPALRSRFLHEARSVAALDHPNLCSIHEVAESEGGVPFFAMPLYPGETLQARLARNGTLSAGEARDVARQIAQGLICAHEAGVVHRDLKPGNVMLLPNGVVKILDFGLAKARDQSLSAPGSRMGTVAYMSPEQLRGEPVDARADLWSLGVVLFEMLTGGRPLPGASPLDPHARDVSRYHSLIPDHVRRILERLLQENPEDRYQAASDVLASLEGRTATDRPSGRRLSRSRVHLAGSVATFLLLVGLTAVAMQDREAPTASSATPTLQQQYRHSIAVLPLRNYSGDPAQDYLADGLTEQLTNALSKVEALRVIAHRSVEQFKRSDRSVPDIGRLLDVQYVVDGSVMQAENRIRVVATLIDAAQNTPTWTETFERERRDMMVLQREVALAISRAIEVVLSPEDSARLQNARLVDPDAFASYLKGTQARNQGNFTNDFREAAAHFARAIASDSSYAPSYAGLSFIHSLMGNDTAARRMANKALELDPLLTDAHLAVGMVRQLLDWDWAGAERAFREAIRLNPGYAEAHHELSMLLMRRRRFDEALREAQVTLYLAPVSSRFEAGIAQVLHFSGRYGEALEACERSLALDPTNVVAHYFRAAAHNASGNHASALQTWAELAARGADVRQDLGFTYARMGRRQEALAILDTLKSEWRGARNARDSAALAIPVATVLMGLGSDEQALEWLERGAITGDVAAYLAINPRLRPLHPVPRFRALLRRVGLHDVS